MADDFLLDSSPLKGDDDLIIDSPAPAKSKGDVARPQSPHAAAEAREKGLQAELASLKKINGVIEDVISSLEKAKTNMNTVHKTTESATSLLDTWTRILSQTEHNQRLLLNPTFHGASQDVADAEAEAVARQAALERQHAMEVARREAAVRKAEEESRKREEAAAASSSRGARGVRRTRSVANRPTSGTGRGSTSASSTGYVAVGGTGGRGTSSSRTTRAGSGIARGGRGRARG